MPNEFVGPKIKNITPSAGPASGGTKMIISGSALEHIRMVTFANILAYDIKSTKDTVTCATPAGPVGTVKVQVTDDEGNASNTLDFVYTQG